MQDVKAFRVGLHETVLDSIVNHFHEMSRAHWAAVNVSFFGAIGLSSASGSSLNIPASGRKGLEDRVQVMDHLLGTTNHHAVSALQSPNPATGAHIHVMKSILLQGLRPADVIFKIGVTPVNDDVSGLQSFGQGLNGLFGWIPGRNHHPDHPWLIEFPNKVIQ